MTDLLDRPTSPPARQVAPQPSRLSRWVGGWRVALRLARRDAWRAKGRSLLVLLLIALPVAGVTAIDVYARAVRAQTSFEGLALARLGASADALLTPTDRGPVRQGVLGPISIGDAHGRVPTAGELLSSLPSGSRMVSTGESRNVVIERDGWGVSAPLAVQDVRDPLVAGLWNLRSGRMPATTGEILLSETQARRLRASLGDTVDVSTLAAEGSAPSHRALTVVGIGVGRGSDNSWIAGAALPGVLASRPPDPTGEQPVGSYLVATGRDLTWADVRALNKIGVLVTSRSVIESPPAFCPVDVMCLDSGPVIDPATGAPPDSRTESEIAKASRVAAQYAAIAGVVVVLVVLQIALLAGPAFAVQLRRRQRELGLVGASGGDAASLRRTVLASGVVLGVLGAVLGVAIGWLTVWLLGGPLPWRPLSDLAGQDLGVPPLREELLLVAGIGVLAAVCAALVPAVAAGRGDVIDTLRGRRPLPPVRVRVPLVGLGVGAIGLLVMVYGVHVLDPVVLGVGIVVGELGLVLVMPFLVARGALAATRLPLAPRLAIRDAGRHRMRTTAAACAIAAAAAAAVAASAWSQSLLLGTGASDVAYVDGVTTVFVGVSYDSAGVPTQVPAQIARRSEPVIAAAVPGSAVAALTDISVKGATAGAYDAFVQCVRPGDPARTVEQDQPCGGRTTSGGRLSGSVVLLDDPAKVGLVLGPLAPVDEARAALEAGKAVVLQPGSVAADGHVELRLMHTDSSGTMVSSGVQSLPAVEVLAGALPADVIIGPKALAPGSPLASGAAPDGSTLLLVRPAEPDAPDRPTTGDRIELAATKSGLDLTVAPQQTETDPGIVILAVGAVATFLLALLAGLMVTTLALADGHADAVTLAAVGGPPGLRRRMAGASAGFVAALGCVAGAAAGLVAARVLVPLTTVSGSSPFVTPWAMLGLIVVGVPLLTMAVAWLTTRSHVAMTRRADG